MLPDALQWLSCISGGFALLCLGAFVIILTFSSAFFYGTLLYFANCQLHCSCISLHKRVSLNQF